MLSDFRAAVAAPAQLVTAGTGAAGLDIFRRISTVVVDVVSPVLAGHPPRFVIVKGEITSSDVASRACRSAEPWQFPTLFLRATWATTAR